MCPVLATLFTWTKLPSSLMLNVPVGPTVTVFVTLITEFARTVNVAPFKMDNVPASPNVGPVMIGLFAVGGIITQSAVVGNVPPLQFDAVPQFVLVTPSQILPVIVTLPVKPAAIAVQKASEAAVTV